MGTEEQTNSPGPFDTMAFYVLLLSAHATGKVLAALTGWLVAGMGASLALLLANVDKMATMIDPGALQMSVKFYVATLGYHVLQRMLFAWCDAAIESASGIAKFTDKKPLDQPSATADKLAPFFSYVRGYLHGPQRWLGDAVSHNLGTRGIASIGEFHSNLINYQLLLVMLQLLLVGTSVWALSDSLT